MSNFMNATPPTDTTLTKEGVAADAKAVGNKLNSQAIKIKTVTATTQGNGNITTSTIDMSSEKYLIVDVLLKSASSGIGAIILPFIVSTSKKYGLVLLNNETRQPIANVTVTVDIFYATRNTVNYQLPGWADLPGGLRVSDTPDATKTAADGWAASPAAVAKTQSYNEYTDHTAESGVTIISNSNSIFVTGRNVDVYIGVNLGKTFGSGENLIKNVPKPVANYMMATFVDGNGALRGFGWITPDGNIASPVNLPAGVSYIVAHYTTY